MTESTILSKRCNCPCCGYPTLGRLNAYEICELCNWEDDGQDDANAEEVRGGPNADYSLAEARRNFKVYRVMYAPGRDQRITGVDSKLEYDTKSQLITVFEKLRSAATLESTAIELEIQELERLLQDETSRQIREYESKQTGF
jgi:Cysteine-rich CPCC